MEKKIVVTKRFRNNTLSVYQYLLKEFSVKTANVFLDKIEDRIELIAKYPTAGKPSSKKKISAALFLLPTTRFFTGIAEIKLKYFVCLICERTRERNRTDFNFKQ